MAFSYWPGPIVTSYAAAYAYHIRSIMIHGHRFSVCVTWAGIHLLIQSDWGQQILNNQYLSLTVFSFLHVRRAVAVDIYRTPKPICPPRFICLRKDNSNNFAPYVLFYVVLMFCYVVCFLFRIADHPANQHLASPASTHPNYNTGTFTRPKKKPLIVSSHIPASNIDNDSDLEAELPALNSDHESDDDAPVMQVNIQPPTPTVQVQVQYLGVHMGIDETTKFLKSELLRHNDHCQLLLIGLVLTLPAVFCHIKNRAIT